MLPKPLFICKDTRTTGHSTSVLKITSTIVSIQNMLNYIVIQAVIFALFALVRKNLSYTETLSLFPNKTSEGNCNLLPEMSPEALAINFVTFVEVKQLFMFSDGGSNDSRLPHVCCWLERKMRKRKTHMVLLHHIHVTNL